VVLIPERAPNANAYAECFVRSIKEECLDRLIPMEGYFRRAVAEYVEHYHRERNHQGLDNYLIAGPPVIDKAGRVRRGPGSAGRSISTSGRRDHCVGRGMEHYGNTVRHCGNTSPKISSDFNEMRGDSSKRRESDRWLRICGW
jgi:hypothetical protein